MFKYYLMHRSAPKIVVKYIPHRSLGFQIAVVFNSADIVEDKVTVETIIVTRQACQKYYRRQC